MPGHVDEQRRILSSAFRRSGLSIEQLWTQYFALGGDAGSTELEAYLNGLMPLPWLQRDVLAHAINERLEELTRTQRVTYSRPVRAGRSLEGPLAALVELLDGMHLARPERLTEITAEAGRLLGVGIVIYLVNYEQRELIPLPDPARTPRRYRSVSNSTLPGRAFRLVQTIPSGPGVRRNYGCRCSTGRNGSEFSRSRWPRTRTSTTRACARSAAGCPPSSATSSPSRRTMATAWTWRACGGRAPGRGADLEPAPPLTAGTDTFSLAGVLEPCYDVGGDAFDYSLSETTASLAIFDAVGHDLQSGFIAGAAMAAYRSARRAGGFSTRRGRSTKRSSASSASGCPRPASWANWICAGRLRYLVARHPRPLVLRSGKVVKTLGGGSRMPLGVGEGAQTIAEERLQPGDWLVLYTDGITEARDPAGEFFGDDRLVDFLEREAANRHPPPETVRRLIHAVLKYQNGVLQDDATVLLARWIDKDELTQ